jgi:hypothetical protein
MMDDEENTHHENRLVRQTIHKRSYGEKFKAKALDALDCPCSALALNCCQLGCFISDVPRRSSIQDSHADWMYHLLQTDPNIQLRSMCIPGSHDSATNTISSFKPFSAVGRTQNVCVSEQLLRGIRYLDIRMAGTSTGVGIFHGCLGGSPLSDILHKITEFLKQHPHEFLFLDFVAEFGRNFTSTQKKEALDMIQEYLGPYLYKGKDCNDLLNHHSLQELVQANQRVCLLLHPRIFNDFVWNGTVYDCDFVHSNYHYFDSTKVMHNKWHNTRDICLLLKWNIDELEHSSKDRAKILVNQFLLTPGVGGPTDVFQLLFGLISLRPISFAQRLIPSMEEFFRNHAEMTWHVLMMDFIDLVPGLLSFIMSLNFPSQLHIVRATINTTNDVTEQMTKFVYRNKVLFLTNVRSDLELTQDQLEGTLKVHYQLQKGHATQPNAADFSVEWDFDEDTEVVLSEYTHFLAMGGSIEIK